jgi:hypothetical protein
MMLEGGGPDNIMKTVSNSIKEPIGLDVSGFHDPMVLYGVAD